jgi:hypothetical protein
VRGERLGWEDFLCLALGPVYFFVFIGTGLPFDRFLSFINIRRILKNQFSANLLKFNLKSLLLVIIQNQRRVPFSKLQ